MVIAEFRSAIADLRYTPQGEAKLSLTVPYGDRMLVQPLMDAFGLELKVVVSRVKKGAR